MKRILIGLALLGCGHQAAMSVDAAPTIDAGGSDGTGAGSFRLTSSSFIEGAAIPVLNTCSGANTSPPLAWSGAPLDAQSFAVVLTDLSITLTHWVIYDIPATVTELPASVENTSVPSNVPGAHQTLSVHAPVIGYYGPCPTRAPPTHTYQFAAYALDVVTLPGVSAQSMPPDAVAAIQTHRLGSGTLTGTFALP